MITGRWGKPAEVLLDIEVKPDGAVTGIANPGRQNAPIRRGQFDASTGEVEFEGEYGRADGTVTPFHIEGRLDGRTLRLAYRFGDMEGQVDIVRVEEYRPPRLTALDRLKPRLAALKRWISARSRPSGEQNARALLARGESLDSIVFRDAVAADIPALAELHVTTWNATYSTTRGPTVATRTWQWNGIFAKSNRRDFVLVLEDRNARLLGGGAHQDLTFHPPIPFPVRSTLGNIVPVQAGWPFSSRRSERAMTSRCISLVPSPISQIFASRIIRSTGYSFVYP